MFGRSFTLLPITALAAVTTAMPGALKAAGAALSATLGPPTAATRPFLDLSVTLLAGLLGVVVGDVTALNCDSIVGVLSSSSCTQEPVCCTGNSYRGLIVLGCSPINL